MSPLAPRATRLSIVVLLLALLAATGSCSQGAPTQLLVRVETDMRSPDDMDALVVRTLSNGHVVETQRFELGTGANRFGLPGSFGVVPAGGDATRRVSLEIDVMRGTCRLYTYRVSSAFAAGQVTTVNVFLARQCAGNVIRDRCTARDVCASPAFTCTRGGACMAVDAARPMMLQTLAVRPAAVPTNGAAIAITPDDSRAVAANRRANSVTVFDLDLSARTLTRPQTLAPPTTDRSGRDPEAWAVVMGNDNNTAFIALRHEQRVVRLDDLRTTAHFARESAPTGSEPTGLAITPSGRHLYVANHNEGTVTVVATSDMHVEMTLDLNDVLARSGRLGPSVRSRAALAHPRAVVITNDGDGDDGDEVAYVTEFFSQAREPGEVTVSDGVGGRRTLDPATDVAFWDVARVGVVYRIPLDRNVPDEQLITIDPVEDTGELDAARNRTGCFPNQLYSAEINGGRLYVSGFCTSPRGPVGESCASPPCAVPPDEGELSPGNYKTLLHAAVFSIDTARANPGPPRATLLTELYRAMYERTLPTSITSGISDTGTTPVAENLRRMPLLPLGIAFVPGDYIAYVIGYGSDAIFRVIFEGGAATEVGAVNTRGYIDLARDGDRMGHLPIGIAIGHNENRDDPSRSHTHTALVLNANTLNVSVLNLTAQEVQSVVPAAAADRVETTRQMVAREGRRFFVTGTDRWSWRGQAWSSCESCHPDGLSDGVTWFFARGPRQTPSLDGSFAQESDGRLQQRLFGWMASFDEMPDLDNVVRNTQGGVGAIVHRASSPPRTQDRIIYSGEATTAGSPRTVTSQLGLNGSSASISSPRASGEPRSVVDALEQLAGYVQTIRAPRHPVALERIPEQVEAGRALFNGSCAGCHGSLLWSTSRRFYEPSEANNHGVTGRLRNATYTLPTGFPPALNPAAGAGPTTFRYTNPTAPIANANDHIQCALRAVGTVGGELRANNPQPVAPPGVAVRELRTNMSDAAQGLEGFSPPSLLGASMTAPYFHAGNARTLEEILSMTFVVHRRVWCANCYREDSASGPTDVRNIVAFLLSIDDDTTPVPVHVPDVSYGNAVDLCAQWDRVAP